jgi:hypothetical protein
VNGFGYGAAFDLVDELGFEVHRNVRPPSALAPPSSAGPETIWWLNADSQVCPRDDDTQWAARSWIDSGGTAVVFLRAPGPGCKAIGGFELPELEGRAAAASGACGPAAPDEDEEAEEGAPLGDGRSDGELRQHDDPDCRDDALTLSDFRALVAPPEASDEPEWITGPLARAPRELSIAHVERFAEPAEGSPWQVVARLGGAPFVLEATSGSGRIVVVADDRFVTNRYLDFNDASLLVVDLVTRYGDPTFDEFSHGHRPAGGALPYLARSPAWPVFAAIAVVGLLVVLRGSAVPKRSVQEADPRAPAVEPFVDSLSNLYAASSDEAGILTHYREQIIDLARRSVHLPVGAPRSSVIARTCSPQLPASEIERELSAAIDVRGAGGFEREVNRLDALLEKMTR